MLSYIRNIQGADSQFEHFIPNYVQGLSQPGLLRLNQSIEAFVYCVLEAMENHKTAIHRGRVDIHRDQAIVEKDSTELWLNDFLAVSMLSKCEKILFLGARKDPLLG